MSDDHAAHAISAYGSRINQTPNLDRIADGGMRLDSAFCTNSISDYQGISADLLAELDRLQAAVGDQAFPGAHV